MSNLVGFRDYPQVTVYHPSYGNGHKFMNIGFSGFVGGLSGFSETLLGISEIGVAYPDASFGSESRIGYPFIVSFLATLFLISQFLLRDILQWDVTIDDAINRMINTRRTCSK
jgi:exportin-7